MKSSAPLVALFSAIDGSGGAGLLADCRAIHAAAALPLAITTALTAQNLNGVQAYWPLPPARVRTQFAATAAAPLAAVKIGVVGRAAAAIAGCLKSCPAPIVWDPVLAASSGAVFAAPAAVPALRRHLLPLAAVITPNRRELLQLGGSRRVTSAINNRFSAGCRRLLVTDINGKGKQVHHVLLSADSRHSPLWELKDQRVAGVYHGSGCLFSSTLAAHLAHGQTLPAAAAAAHQTVAAAIQNAASLPALGRQQLLRV